MILFFTVDIALYFPRVKVQCRLAYFGQFYELRVYRVGELDSGGSVVPDGVLAGFLEFVLGAPAPDGAGAGAVPDGVEVPFPGDPGRDRGQERLSLLRGGKPGRRPGGRRGRLW